MTYTVTENGTIEFDWEKVTPEEYKARLESERSENELDMAA